LVHKVQERYVPSHLWLTERNYYYIHSFIDAYKSSGKAGSARRTQDWQEEDDLVLDGKNSDFSVFDLQQMLDATDNFSEENKLGQGGFGAVYKVT